ncbi:MAG: B12-binding domain-containing radical SAM protein [Proteobacteria bacterium]|nr:B12-binding domain-containing radical SAM protein [Pseudomonadota bacterium]
MRVLLLQPPIQDYYTTSIRNYPLGLLFIASYIKDLCDVEIIDLRQGYKSEIETPFKELDKIYNKMYSPFSLFSRFQRFGLNREGIKEIIINKKPDIIGISSLFSTYFEEALEVAKIAKEVNNKIVTVLGGNHPTLFPEDVLREESVDFVIRGEGEIPFRRLIENFGNEETYKSIEGLCFKRNGDFIISTVFFNESKTLSLDRKLLSKENYKYGKGYVAPVVTSRGCPYSCDFCSKPEVKFRFYNIEDVKKDIDNLISLGFDTIDFEDDYFDITLERNKEILKWLKDKDIKVTAMNGVIPKIDYEVKRLIKSTGFQRINISLVDANKEVKEFVNRGQFEEFDRVLNYFIESQVPVEVHFIIGMPEQRMENLIDTMIYLGEKQVLLGPSVYYLAPGSNIYNKIIKKRGIINLKYTRSSALYQVNEDFDTKTLATFLRLARFVNYIKSIIDQEERDLHVDDFLRLITRKNRLDGIILKALFEKQIFISFDKKNNVFYEDAFDREVIKKFLSQLKFVCGYKTENICSFI